MTITGKWILGLSIWLSTGWAGAALAAPPMPARIGGTVTIKDTQLTQASGMGYTFSVTRKNGSAYTPEATDSDVLNVYNWYIINIPIHDAKVQTGGAKPGNNAFINVYKKGKKLKFISPDNGRFVIGPSGSATRIDIVVEK